MGKVIFRGKERELRKLKIVTGRLVNRFNPERIILFGSYAWGNPTADSDFDLLIVKEKQRDFLMQQQKVREIIDGEIAADILIYTSQEIGKRLKMGDFFFEDIMTRGTVLYDKSKKP